MSPLRKSCSTKTFQGNVKEMIKSGRTKEQGVAAAYTTLRNACLSPKTAQKAKKEKWTPKEIAGECLDDRFERVAGALNEAVLGMVSIKPFGGMERMAEAGKEKEVIPDGADIEMTIEKRLGDIPDDSDAQEWAEQVLREKTEMPKDWKVEAILGSGDMEIEDEPWEPGGNQYDWQSTVSIEVVNAEGETEYDGFVDAYGTMTSDEKDHRGFGDYQLSSVVVNVIKTE